MSEYVGMFIVPAEHLDDLYELEKEKRAAWDELRQDMFYRENQVYQRAHDVAVSSCILHGHVYGSPKIYFCGWLQGLVLHGEERAVFDADELDTLSHDYGHLTFDMLAAWMTEQEKTARPMDREVLRELFEMLGLLISAAPPGPHGLVVECFDERHRESPEVRAARREREWILLAKEDNDKVNAIFEEISVESRCRERPGWDKLEGGRRRFLGLISPDDAPSLHDSYRYAQAPLAHRGIADHHRRMRAFVDQVEPMLKDGVIHTRAGPATAHSFLSVMTNWGESGSQRELATPEQARELWRRLDELEVKYGDERGVARYVQKFERYWRLGVALAAYRELRATLALAIEREWWFLWLREHY